MRPFTPFTVEVIKEAWWKELWISKHLEQINHTLYYTLEKLMKKILITGGAGFIGSHTAVALHENGCLPVIIDNFSNSEKSVLEGLKAICQAELPCYEGNCGDKTFLAGVFDQEDISGVIHFAAFKSVNESFEKPFLYYQNNLTSLISLLEVMAERGVVPLVFSSSCTVYGSPDKIPVNESAPFKETPSTYGKTKQISEKIIEDIISTGKEIKAVLLRYFNPIGAHPSGLIGELPIGIPNNLVPYVTQTAAGIRDKLTIFGNDYNTPDGTCIRDFIHVMDLALAHVKAFEYLDQVDQKRCCEKFNVGTGLGNSVKEVVDTFERVTGQKLNYAYGPRRPGDVEAVYANADRAKDLMNWETHLSLEDSIRDAWNWQQRLSNKK